MPSLRSLRMPNPGQVTHVLLTAPAPKRKNAIFTSIGHPYMNLKVQHQYKTKYVPKVGRALRENF